MANDHHIIQWNCRGLRDKRHEIDLLIAKFAPAVICLQETLLTPNINPTFRNYQCYYESKVNGTHGVGILVKDSIPQSRVHIPSFLEFIAINVTIQGKTFVISNHYISPRQVSSQPDLSRFHLEFNKIINNFKFPYLLCGDFNGHNNIWSHKEDSQGKMVEAVMHSHNLLLLNTTEKTRSDARSSSLLDLTLVHPLIYLEFSCTVLSDRYLSDHHPVVITMANDLSEVDKVPKWNFKKANWGAFHQQCLDTITYDLFDNEVDKMSVFSTELLNIAVDNIPQSSPFHKKKSKPWFDAECQAAKRARNNADRINRRYPNLRNAMRAKLMQAKARRIFRKKKRESWRNYVSSINSKTPSNKVWNMIRKINGKNVPNHLHHLKDPNGNLITNKEDIANRIAQTFENNSSSDSYSEKFQNIKQKQERTKLDFHTNDHNLRYNKKFKLRDLKRALRKAKDSAPGIDQIHYQILKHLPDETLRLLLSLINDTWSSQTFPESWRVALLLPIPKPGKNHYDPINYRPIALTSCICKTVERMVNERLIWYLERHNLLSKFQAGFRAHKSTLDQLIRMESYIRDALANNDHLVAVFFDLQKAYDTTWKYGILKDLHTMGLRGNLPVFIDNFLCDRSFMVVFGAVLSNTYVQEEGVPQGAILSTTLFNVKLNNIVKVLCPDVKCSLYVDDFVIIFRSSTVQLIERRLQTNINKILDWTLQNGFTISSNKTVAMHFCLRRKCFNPTLKLGNVPIEFVEEHKFLGLIWDNKLNFRAHIDYLKKKCIKALDLLKVVSHTVWGSDTKTLIKLYKSLVLSKLDYGAIVYMSASNVYLKKLDVVHNQGLRLCLGAFKSSPVESLYAEAFELPLEERRYEAAIKYALKVKANPDNAAYPSIFNPQFRHLFQDESVTDPFGIFVEKQLEEASIDIDKILPNKIPVIPVWDSKPIHVSFALSEYDKSSTSPEIFQAKFCEIVSTYYKDYFRIYTDGSKFEEKASSAIHAVDLSQGFRIADDSIFSQQN